VRLLRFPAKCHTSRPFPACSRTIRPDDIAPPRSCCEPDTWYKVSSSFCYYPGLLVWKSTDLVNWIPVGPTLPNRSPRRAAVSAKC
jgi:beta-xylosidase